MKSKAHLKGHPIHPMLVNFPIAFLSGTFLFDLLGFFCNDIGFWAVGYYLEAAGVGFALLAAVPGAVDYFYTVPPKSTGKKRATKHALTNITMLIIFACVWFYRRQDDPSPYIILIAEFVGLVLLSFAGWMGGTLVFRNQIGVDPRYANAGKWKEMFIKDDTGNVQVATSDELEVNQMKLIHLNDMRIVLGRTEEGYCAFDDHCTHRGGSLAGGAMMCETVQCPWHGSQFNVMDGSVKAGPAKSAIRVYEVSETAGKVYLQYKR